MDSRERVAPEQGAATALSPSVRAFVAVELPEPVRAALAGAQSALGVRTRAGGVGQSVRWVDPRGIHLTLKFLGNVAPEQITPMEQALVRTLARQRSFRLRLGGLGMFPSARSPRVVWIGVEGDLDELTQTAGCVEEALAPFGFPTESRPFTPHLTLGRVREETGADDRRQLGEVVSGMPAPPKVEISADAVSLMRSELGPAGVRYSQLFAVPLVERST